MARRSGLPRLSRVQAESAEGAARHAHSDRREQRQREPGPLVDPLIPLGEPGGLDQLADAVGFVLVRALGPDRLALLEAEAEGRLSRSRTSCAARLTRCISTRDASRFQTARCANRSSAKFASSSRVQPQQQVLVEGAGQAQRIVVREQQVAFRLDEVGAEQQVIARVKRARESGRGTRPRRADRSCRCSSRGRPPASDGASSAGSASSPSS